MILVCVPDRRLAKQEMPDSNKYIPYGRHTLDDDDIQAVCRVLRSDWLTTGPLVAKFEAKVQSLTGADFAAAVSSGTAALHAIMAALEIKPGDEVILPPMTFAATANVIVHQGGTPVFADVDPDTLLIDPGCVAQKLNDRTRAVIAVDYAGQACDYDALKAVCKDSNVPLVADACHALGGSYKGRMIGSVADLTAFSFHPVKAITTGEGGVVTTDSQEYTEKIQQFRNHGIDMDHQHRAEACSWEYQIESPGLNYRITDIQCALGISQLDKLTSWIEQRNRIAEQYDLFFGTIDGVSGLKKEDYGVHARHLYVILLDPDKTRGGRRVLFEELRQKEIGVNVHYKPVYLHPYYQKRFGFRQGECPHAEQAYERMVTLPLYPGLSQSDQERVCRAVSEMLEG